MMRETMDFQVKYKTVRKALSIRSQAAQLLMDFI